ncbi:MAG: PQQ-dependent sugar dehydrogenase [Aquihabitans sp.]
MTSTHRGRTAAAAIALTALVVMLATGCGQDDTVSGPDGGASSTQVGPSAPQNAGPTAAGPVGTDNATPKVTGSPVASLEEPIVLLPRPGDDDLWVGERAGLVRRLRVAADGTMAPDGEPVLDITSQTTTDAERGLLGLAFSKNGDTLYVSHTDPDGNSRVAAYAIEDNAVRAASRKVLFAVDQPYANHNGGNIVLGPDGGLWLGLGDGGAGDDPENRAQNPKTPLGKLIRVATDGSGSYDIIASGLRNPWRYSFDADRSLWIGDVGQNEYEEIDHLAYEDITGANFGWSGYEGAEPYLDGDGRRPTNPVAPLFTYSHDGGNCSITGGFVYRGKAIRALQGAYLFADYCAGNVRAITVTADGSLDHEIDLGLHVDQPISFGTDAAGEAYVLSADGSIVRLS